MTKAQDLWSSLNPQIQLKVRGETQLRSCPLTTTCTPLHTCALIQRFLINSKWIRTKCKTKTPLNSYEGGEPLWTRIEQFLTIYNKTWSIHQAWKHMLRRQRQKAKLAYIMNYRLARANYLRSVVWRWVGGIPARRFRKKKSELGTSLSNCEQDCKISKARNIA